MVEAVAAAAFGILVAYLVLFGLDRVWDTPGWLRVGLFVAAAAAVRQYSVLPAPVGLAASAAGATGPAALAQAPAGRRPVAGDHRAGAQRIRAGAVAGPVRGRHPRGRPRRRAASISAMRFPIPAIGSGCCWRACRWPSAVCLLALFPAAAVNAWQRFLAPWGSTPRYTFTGLEKLPDRIVVAHGEPFSLALEAHGEDGVATQAGSRPAWRSASR